MKSKVAFLYQARKMPNTIIPALHLKRNIFECFRFFNFPFSIQFWRLNPSNLSSDFFCGEISAGIDGWTCLLAGRWWRTGTGSPDSELEAGGGAERWALGQVLPGHPPLRRAPEAGVAEKGRRSWHLICLSGWAYFSEMFNAFVNMSYEICCT